MIESFFRYMWAFDKKAFNFLINPLGIGDHDDGEMSGEIGGKPYRINWTRVLIFLIGFGFLFVLIFGFFKNLRK